MTAVRSRRNRRVIVCTECKRRRIKCSKQHPCAHCEKRGLNCEYAAEGASAAPVSELSILKSRVEMLEERLDRYEKSDGDGCTGAPCADHACTTCASHACAASAGSACAEPADHTCATPVQRPDPQSTHTPLNIKLSNLKYPIILYKPSRTWIVGRSSRWWLISPVLMNMFSGLTDAISREKIAWKGLHQSIIQLDRLGGTAVESTTVDSINSIICPNYFAFQERLLYFQTELNGLLFTNMIPMDMIHSLFLTYFSLSESSTAHFNKPHKAYCYADISLITAVVYVVVIFTQHSTHVFHHQLPASSDQLSSLALSLLNLSKFKRKKTHQVLLSLIVVRTGLFVFDNAERMNELTGTYQTFQLVLDLCYQMGLYTDPDTTSIVMLKEKTKARLLSGSRVRELWNYVQTQDAFYSLKMGTPLLINYDFCQGFYRSSDLPFERKREEGVLLMRELSIIINSPRPVSIRDLLDVIRKVLQYCRPDNEGIDDLDEIAYLFKQRLILGQSLEFLFRMAIVGIRDLNGPDELSRQLFRQLALSAVTILYQIREVFSGKSVFGEDRNGSYIVYFKDVFARALGQSFLTWFTFLLPGATENSVLLGELERQAMIFEYPTEAPYSYEIDLRVLERALYHEENVELGEQLFARIINSSELMAFATTFYDLLCQSDVMKSSLNSFLTIKLVIIWAYVVQTFEECKGMGIRPSVPEIIRRARGKVEADFSSGRLDTKKFVSEGEELEQILDSIFEDEWMRG